ncbi:MAG: hypothetical protein ABI863_07180 [Ginsengibacter sp.]
MLLKPVGVAYAQAEVAPWGNLTGIRVVGQLIGFESSLRVVEKDWSKINATGKERQHPRYVRDGNKQIVTTKIDSISFKEIVEDTGTGIANVDVQFSSGGAMKMEGVFFSVALPLEDYSAVVVQSNKNSETTTKLATLQNDLRYAVSKIKFGSSRRNLEFVFEQTTTVIIKKNSDTTNKAIQVYIPILEGDAQSGTTAQKKFMVKAGGYIDNRPVTFKLNTSKEGRPFDGFGGNFRLQNPKADPQVIDYCLQNMRVAWGRVEFPWRFWQPGKNDDPLVAAKNGKLNPRVQQAMDMAVRLHKMGIPLILSGWFPPQWAVVGNLNFRPSPGGVWGNQLDTANMNEIYKSIADYILYLKNNYGAEVALFSFNESDLGINVRQTPLEHAALIKGLGAYFKSKGLSTKMLLGDNSDATTYEFIYPAMHDADAIPYIGAISFHSWRGWEKGTLQKWKAAADELKVPLIVGEGSIDAAAWNYPAIFEEQTYVLQEINLYIRLLSICQPLTILQWQLTSDYSPLAGGGIFGNNDSLRPTQRFWNFKQLAFTPKGLFAMAVTYHRPDVTCAAFGDNAKGIYTIHIVNNGAGRDAVLTGMPSAIKALSLYVTDKSRAMKKGAVIKVSNSKIKFHLDSESYVTLITE